MLSFQKWRMLNESLGGMVLGVRSPQNFGVQSGPYGTFTEKKKMDGDAPEEDVTGDGEMVEPSSEKDEPEVSVKKGDDCPCVCNKMSKKMSTKKSPKKMCSDEAKKKPDEDMENADDDYDDDEDIEDSADDEGEEGEDILPEPSNKQIPVMSKKKSGKKMKKESVEDLKDDFFKNLASMTRSPGKFWGGYKEEVLLAPENEVTPIDEEPKPGDVGYAPQQRMN